MQVNRQQFREEGYNILRGVVLKHTTENPASLWGNGRDITYLGNHFTPEQAAELWRRFQSLDEKLKLPEETRQPGFQRMSAYDPNDMPMDYSVEDFIRSWDIDS